MTEVHILSKATFIQAYGLLLKAPTNLRWGFLHSTTDFEVTNGTAQLHKHKILGYVGVYVDDLLIAGPRSLNDTLTRAVQGIWKTSAPEHLGPDPDCVSNSSISRHES